MARRLKSPGTVGSPIAINSPNVIVLDSEDNSVTSTGVWSSVEDAEAVGGSYLQSNVKDSSLQFNFKGSALWVRFKFGSDCGKATITIDDKVLTMDLYSPLPTFKYVNVAVGLDENVSHVAKISVAEEKNERSTGYYVRVDTFIYRTTEEALSLQNIDYIDLINVINTINRINEISTISTINEISLIRRIADAPWIANMGVMMNGSFETGNLAGWFDPAGIATVTDAYADLVRGSKYSCNLKHGDYGLIQFFNPPLPIEGIVEFSLQLLAEDPENEMLEIYFFTTDGLAFGFTVTSPLLAKNWEYRNVWDNLQDTLESLPSMRGKHAYAIWFRNCGSTDGLYIDSITLLAVSPSESKNLSDISVTVEAGTSAESPNAGTFPVTPSQIVGVSFEMRSSNVLYSTESKLEVRVKLYNKDGTLNSTLTYTPPRKPTTDYTRVHFFKKIPAGVSYADISAYFTNAENMSVTITIRNIKVFPIQPFIDKEGRIELSPSNITSIRWGVPREPLWIDGIEITAPGAGFSLISQTVSAGKTGRVFGVHISSPEANEFQLCVGATVIKRFALAAAGVIHIVSATPLKDGIPAGSTITIKTVNAGGSGKVYQASLLYDEG